MMTTMKSEYGDKMPSTRRMILDKALQTVNQVGEADFRIDALAGELGLSPGNITYHFAKKDDICTALWNELLDRFGTFDVMFSGMLDLKQLYLIVRAMNGLLWSYRGVVMSRGGDIRLAAGSDKPEGQSISQMTYTFFERAHDILRRNGYLRDNVPDMMMRSVLDGENIMLRSWINLQVVTQACDREHDLDQSRSINRGALTTIYVMYPILTQKGKDEFAEICRKVEEGMIDA
ncbi:MAG: TetR/AcrR family transcriptional regulator [Rikenellaceae bacterium]|nr:TetR/AcrR family transcriptional regulator [Rikenellaceae bacterium]MDE7356718.1 TetR/AcrR family transcriptional regulator [Rikenellaceae bacterium]